MNASNLIFMFLVVGLIAVSGCIIPPPPDGVCGDGDVDFGEECDDGNDVDNDGCTGCVIDIPPECLVDGDCDSGFVCVDNVCEEEIINPTGLFVLNGDFESSDVSSVVEISAGYDWLENSLTRSLGRNTVNPVSGSGDYKISVTGAMPVDVSTKRPAIALGLSESTVAGETYTVSFKVKQLSGTSTFKGLTFGNDDLTELFDSIPGGQTTNFEYDLTSDGSWDTLNLHFNGNSVNSFQIDDILIDGVGPAEPTCEDGIQNGDETGVDCGGSELGCPACPVENQPPTVEITSPQNLDYFEPGETITITATANDVDGTITKVEFYERNNYLGQVVEYPYTYDWSTNTNSTYSLLAKAYDNSGTDTTSDPVSIVVGTTTGTNGFVCENTELQCGGPCAGCPPPDGATAYYISNDGDDLNDGLDKLRPWKTTEKLFDEFEKGTFELGDYILFKRGDIFEPEYYTFQIPANGEWEVRMGNPGTYYTRRAIVHVNSPLDGPEDMNLVIGAYGEKTDPKPIFRYPDIPNNPATPQKTFANNYAFKIDEADHITIQDIEIQTGKDTIINPTVDDWTEDIKLLRITFATNSGGIGCGWSYDWNYPYPNLNLEKVQDFEVGWSEFHETRGNEDAINCLGDDIYIHHNKFYGIYQEAIDLAGGDNHIIEYNLISGSTTNGIKIHSQGAKVSNVLVQGNVILGVVSHSVTFQSIDGLKFYHNTIISPVHAMHLGMNFARNSQFFENSGDFDVKNNIIEGRILFDWLDTLHSTYTYYDGRLWERTWTQTPPWERGVFENNLHASASATNDVVKTTKWSGSYNWYFGTYNSNSYKISSTLEEDENRYAGQNGFNIYESWSPNIRNNMHTSNLGDNMINRVQTTWQEPYGVGDYNLKSTSEFIDAGIVISGYVADLDGKEVPQGSAPEPGAYEYKE